MSPMIRSLRRQGLPTAVLVLVMGCATPSSAPDDMSASDHRSTAHERIKEAAGHRGQYDPDAVRAVPGGYHRRYGGYYDDYSDGFRDAYWDAGDYNPTQSHLVDALTLEGEASDHLKAAKTLEKYEEQQCAAFPPKTRVTCPILGHIEAVTEVFGGVQLRFDESVNVNAAVAHVRCHMAFARTRARVGMEACPLYTSGLSVARVGDRTIELTASDREGLEELRSRSRRHLAVPVPNVKGP